MKNLFKVFGIIALVAIIGFSFTACGGDDDGDGTGGGGGGGSGGTLTITNIPAEYNGKNIRGTPVSSSELLGTLFCGTISNYVLSQDYKISKGSVSIPMTLLSKRYDGNDTVLLRFAIWEPLNSDGSGMNYLKEFQMNVSFSKGSAKKSWNDAIL